MTTTYLKGPKFGSVPRGETSSESVERPALDAMLDQTLQTKHDFWIQTIRSMSDGPNDGVYLSTFQKGQGQHVTTLTADQARILGWRLIRLAGEIEESSAA